MAIRQGGAGKSAVNPMKILVPLYIYPLRDGRLATEWQKLKEAQDAGVAVVAVVNPASGPGTAADRPSYEKGMQALRDSGVEVIGYVASGYGRADEKHVKAQIDIYKEWYGRWVSGIFIDETAHVADDVSEGDSVMAMRYRGYHSHVKKRHGDSATVVMNTGTMITEAALTRLAGSDVVWNVLENSLKDMEKSFGKFAQPVAPKRRLFGWSGRSRGKKAGAVEGAPPPAPDHVEGRAAFMVHGACDLSFEELCHWSNKLRSGGWTHVYLTDKVFDPTSSNTALHNPWDALPSYWEDMVKALGVTGKSSGGSGDSKGTFCCYA